MHTTHGRTTSHGLPHVKQNLHATTGQSHSGTTGRTVGRGKNSLSPQPLPRREGSNYQQPSCIAFPRFPTFPCFPSLPLSSPRSSLRFFTLHSSLTYEIKEKEEKSGANLPYRPSDHARLYNFAEEIQRATSYRQSSWWITISDNRHELTRLLERRHENARNAING